MKDMGEIDVILGINIMRDCNQIKLSQSHYVEKILKRFSTLSISLYSCGTRYEICQTY